MTIRQSQSFVGRDQNHRDGHGQMGMAGEKKKSISNRIDQPVGHVNTAAFLCHVVPDVVQVRGGLRRNTVCHQWEASCSAVRRARPRRFTSSATVPHGFLRDRAALAACKRGFGVVEDGQKFRPFSRALQGSSIRRAAVSSTKVVQERSPVIGLGNFTLLVM
jgi:hypothetical protein